MLPGETQERRGGPAQETRSRNRARGGCSLATRPGSGKRRTKMERLFSTEGRGWDGAARGRRAARWFGRSTSRRVRAARSRRRAGGAPLLAARGRGASGACAERSWARVGSKFGSLFFAGQHANEKNRDPIYMLGWSCSYEFGPTEIKIYASILFIYGRLQICLVCNII